MVTPDLTTLGGRIQKARKDAGFTNVERLAVEMGVGQRTVQRWETGKSDPSVRQLVEIAKLTNHPLAYFFEDGKVAA